MTKRSEEEIEKIKKKRIQEQQTVDEMIKIYCHGVHKSQKGHICDDCQELLEYSQARSANCPFMETKTFCSNCKVHCYKPEMREKIKVVMRYSGPRMLFHHPVMTIRHLVLRLQNKHLEKKNNKKRIDD